MALTKKPAKEQDLCKPCAVAMAQAHSLKRQSGKADKITCASCGRRRYGLTYEVTKKSRSEKR